MTAAELAALVPDSREIGQGRWAAPCPSCGGSPRSRRFRFRDGDDRVLIFCFSCRDSDAILRVLDLRWPELLLHNAVRRHDPEAARRRKARDVVRTWRSAELTRLCAELRHLDLLEDQAGRRLKADTDEEIAWQLLAIVYDERPKLEADFERLTSPDEATHIEVYMEHSNAE